MTDNMKAFVDAVSGNEELKGKVNGIGTKEQEEMKEHIAEYIALAKEAGITLTEEDFRQENSSEMSDEELQAVSGGTFCILAGGGSSCICAYVGGGAGSFCPLIGW